MTNSQNYIINIEEQALEFLRNYALLAYTSIIIGCSLIAILLYICTESITPLYWFCLIFVTQTLSYLYRRKLTDSDLTHKSKIFRGTLINCIDGLLISSGLLFLPFINEITGVMIINILIVACAGSTTTTVGYKPFYLSFSLPIMAAIASASFISAYFWDKSDYYYFITLLSAIITYVLYSLSVGIFNHFKAAFIANLENIKINKELQIAVDEARKANQSKTRFLASASHDLRQPMTTLSLFIASMSMKPLPPEEAEIITHMSTAINSIDAQLDSLLDISKLDAGIIKVNKGQHDIVKFVSRLVTQYNEQYKDEDAVPIRFSSKLEHATALMDIVLFERIIRNLVGNAIKYTPNGYINIEIDGQENHLDITVTDTGVGINDKKLKHVFDEFYQAGNPERDGKKGLGLGLSIVKRICELLDMDISIKSEEGIGTSVKVSTECDTIHKLQEADVNLLDVNVLSQEPSKRIIALDNELPILNALKSVLEAMGHNVITFTDAKNALLSFSEQPFDLALIDYRLPGKLNGLDVIKQMQRLNNNTKCFLVTGDSNLGETADQYNVIYKPVTNKKLEFLFN